MSKKIEKLADDLMNLTKDEAQQLQLIIKAKIMPEVERQRGLLNDQMAQNPQMANMGRQQPMAPRAATQRDVRMQGLLRWNYWKNTFKSVKITLRI